MFPSKDFIVSHDNHIWINDSFGMVFMKIKINFQILLLEVPRSKKNISVLNRQLSRYLSTDDNRL